MRVLFVDIDGVLHPAGDALEDVGPKFVWLPLLAELLAPYPDVIIAIHSTWRYDHTQEELLELFAPLGKRSVVTVPRGPRYEAINWFLQMNQGVTSYRILDDAPKEFGAEPPQQLVVCRSKMGLTTEGVIEQLQEWLEGSSESS